MIMDISSTMTFIQELPCLWILRLAPSVCGTRTRANIGINELFANIKFDGQYKKEKVLSLRPHWLIYFSHLSLNLETLCGL